MNLKVFNMIKEINELKTLAKHFSFECRCEFDGKKCNSRQKLNNDNCQCECKKPIKQSGFEEDYVSNSSSCAREYYKDCDMGEYLRYCEYIKRFFDYLVVTCDEIAGTTEITSISPSNEINFCSSNNRMFTIVESHSC